MWLSGVRKHRARSKGSGGIFVSASESDCPPQASECSMRIFTSVGALAGTLLLSSALIAQAPPAATEVSGEMRALITLPATNGARLTVTTPAFENGADIPFDN